MKYILKYLPTCFENISEISRKYLGNPDYYHIWKAMSSSEAEKLSVLKLFRLFRALRVARLLRRFESVKMILDSALGA